MNQAQKTKYWDKIYLERTNEDFNPEQWRNLASKSFIEKIRKALNDRKEVLEIGGGGAAISCYLAKKHTNTNFSILDFSKEGCQKAAERSKKEGVKLSIINSDFRIKDFSLEKKFDFIFSLGVVEHFRDLSSTLENFSFYLKEGGHIFTLIPNMASPIYSYLCKKWNKEVLYTHFLYNLKDLSLAHEKAGFRILDSGYLYPMEFSILSMAFVGKPQKGKDWFTFLWLTRISKIIHLLTKFKIKIPPGRYFSPYIFVKAEKIN